MRRAALVLLLSLCAVRARAGNDEAILVGGQAALTAGAVTAITSDGAAAWYNPAGLARIDRHAFDINASAYGISLTSADNLFTLPNGQTSNASVIDWQLVPSALSYSRELSKRVVGSFGVFIPSTSDVDLRAAIRQDNGTRWTFGIDEVRNEYNYIASVAVRMSETLRIGVALHGVYVSDETLVQVGFGMPGDLTQLPFQSSSLHETRSDYCLRLGFGVQWSPLPQWELGLAVQTPTLTGFRRLAQDSTSGSFINAMLGGEYATVHVKKLSQPWDLSTPLFVRFGAAYRRKRAQLLLDGSVSSPLNSEGESQDRKLNGNARVGVLVTQNEALSIGGGVFTDRSGFRDTDTNFVGFAGGVRLGSNYTISEGQRRLTFATTLAGRYAYGWGSTEGASFVESVQPQMVRAALQFHELAFNLGGSVTF